MPFAPSVVLDRSSTIVRCVQTNASIGVSCYSKLASTDRNLTNVSRHTSSLARCRLWLGQPNRRSDAVKMCMGFVCLPRSASQALAKQVRTTFDSLHTPLFYGRDRLANHVAKGRDTTSDIGLVTFHASKRRTSPK